MADPQKKPPCFYLALKLSLNPHKEWLHMDTVELEKLQWTQDLPPLRRQRTQEVSTACWPTMVGVALLLWHPAPRPLFPEPVKHLCSPLPNPLWALLSQKPIFTDQ